VPDQLGPLLGETAIGKKFGGLKIEKKKTGNRKTLIKKSGSA